MLAALQARATSAGTRAALGVTTPGVQHRYEQWGDGERTAWMLHPDGELDRLRGQGIRGGSVGTIASR